MPLGLRVFELGGLQGWADGGRSRLPSGGVCFEGFLFDLLVWGLGFRWSGGVNVGTSIGV